MDTNQQPDTTTPEVTMRVLRIEVTACPDHPTDEPTMPAATCSVCGQQLRISYIGTIQPEQPPICTCTLIRSQTHIEPAEWEQADDCPVHPR